MSLTTPARPPASTLALSRTGLPVRGRDAPSRAPSRPVLLRDPTCRARTQEPRPRWPRPTGRWRLGQLGRRRGRGFPAGRAAAAQARPCRPLPPRAKIKPGDPQSREPAAGGSSACASRHVRQWREPQRAHLRPPPSLPCWMHSGRHRTRMATPPKRSCPSPATGSEGARIKKIAIEGNIGKEAREMPVPEHGVSA